MRRCVGWALESYARILEWAEGRSEEAEAIRRAACRVAGHVSQVDRVAEPVATPLVCLRCGKWGRP